jgi:hypothetical protein
VLLKHLPPESALKTELGGEDSVWTLETQLLAAIYDAVAAGNWQRGGGKGKRPKPIPRPGIEGRERKETFGASGSYTPAQVDAILADIYARQTETHDDDNVRG